MTSFVGFFISLNKPVFSYSVVEKVVRERFAKALTRGMQDLRINKAHNTPINGLIENAVIEVMNLPVFSEVLNLYQTILTSNIQKQELFKTS